MSKLIDLTGQRFTRLLVLGRAETTGRRAVWNCLCDCGTIKTVTGEKLRSGNTKSCGCLNREGNNLRHGYARKGNESRLYRIWNGMKARCKNENIPCYKRYGGRGIEICAEWDTSFIKFRDWAMANGYADNLSIDRKNVDGNYCPENCQWVTMDEQARNKRNNVFITHNGKTQTVMEWSRETGIERQTIQWRISRGWDAEKVLSIPV